MPTKLELQAYYINEIIAQVVCPFYYVSWDFQKLEWKHENTNFRRMWPYYIILIFTTCNILLFLVTISVLYSRSTEIEKIIPHKSTIVAGLLMLICSLLMLIDYLFTVCGRELVYVTNWLYHHEEVCQGKKNIRFAKKLSLGCILKRLAVVFEDFKDPDLIGIAFNCITIGYPFLGLIISVLYVFGRFDPIYIFIDVVNLATIKQSYWFFSFRLLSYFIGVQWILHSARTCILFCVGMCVSFIRLLLNLKRSKVQTTQSLETLLRFYRELNVLLSLITCEVNKTLGNILSLGYLLIVAGVFCFIFGVKENDFKMVIVFLSITVAIFCAVLFVFKIGGFLCSSSSFILKRWRKKCSRWQNFKSKVLLREIDSCRLLTARAGEISVITVNLQQGFLNALLQDSASALLLGQEELSAF